MISIAVALICRNKATELPYVLEALRCQTQRPDEILLVDDGSTDRSLRVFERFGPYRAFRLPPSITRYRLSSARNVALREATADLVLFLDADMVLSRTAVETHVAILSEGASISTGPRLEFSTFSSDRGPRGPIGFMFGHEGLTGLYPKWQTTFGAMLGVNRRAALELGGFDEAFDGAYGFEDLDFTLRAHEAEWSFRGSWEAHGIHIPHPATPLVEADRNKKLFKAKHPKADLTYSKEVGALSRGRWSERWIVKEEAEK